MKREDENTNAKKILTKVAERGDGGTALVSEGRPKHVEEHPHDDASHELEEPENLPAGGSAAEERLRSAEHEEGKAPARQGEERVR